ncbi:hypothetical protein RJT34_12706 [Clitoria ternatea]|uniref:Uncharacterized protein n=1 Tax=Clitoria ternatea TaxID=43366 RepID=A0AAN9JM74_CLITE
MEDPVPITVPEPAPAPAPALIIVPLDVEMVDTTDLPPLPAQLPPSKFMDMMEDLTPPVAPITSLMDGFLARRQWDQSRRNKLLNTQVVEASSEEIDGQ